MRTDEQANAQEPMETFVYLNGVFFDRVSSTPQEMRRALAAELLSQQEFDHPMCGRSIRCELREPTRLRVNWVNRGGVRSTVHCDDSEGLWWAIYRANDRGRKGTRRVLSRQGVRLLLW